MPRPSLKLVHTSDVHLHSYAGHGDAQALCRRQAELAFCEVVDTVRAQRADLFLIAGDLFDSSRVERSSIDFVLAELARVPCPVVLIPGNHDCYDDESIYRRIDLRDAGSHVHPLMSEDGDTFEFHELHATVWGRALVDHDHANRPLDGVPERSGDYWHVGLAHGYLAPDRRELRSSTITPEEIGRSGLDYLALGHVHVFREVSERRTTACYSGSPSPPHAGATDGGSVALVTLDPDSGVKLAPKRILAAG